MSPYASFIVNIRTIQSRHLHNSMPTFNITKVNPAAQSHPLHSSSRRPAKPPQYLPRCVHPFAVTFPVRPVLTKQASTVRLPTSTQARMRFVPSRMQGNSDSNQICLFLPSSDIAYITISTTVKPPSPSTSTTHRTTRFLLFRVVPACLFTAAIINKFIQQRKMTLRACSRNAHPTAYIFLLYSGIANNNFKY